MNPTELTSCPDDARDCRVRDESIALLAMCIDCNDECRLVTSHSLLCSTPTSTPSACVGSVGRMDQCAVMKILGLKSVPMVVT